MRVPPWRSRNGYRASELSYFSIIPERILCTHFFCSQLPIPGSLETEVVVVRSTTSGSAMDPTYFVPDAIPTERVDTTIQPGNFHGIVPASVSGQAHRRFVVVSTLLYLIDPVRGEPTTHSLDRHPHDDTWKHDQLQKKFLDSFALISSTSRTGGDTASAVCLEQGHPSGTVLRLARNLGISDEHLVSQLQEVLDDLTAVALKGIMLIRPSSSSQ